MHPLISDALWWLGIFYALVVPLTTVVGWVRYERTKYILGLSDFAIHDFFGTLGVTVQAVLLGAVFFLTIVSYLALGDYYIFSR